MDDVAVLRSALRAARSLTGSPPPFDPDTVPSEPVRLFAAWFLAAVQGGVPEPHAATLSTVDTDGVPDARVLVVKDVTDDGAWTFSSSRSSAKGRQLSAHTVGALTFFWPAQIRSVRLRGPVEEQTESVRLADFMARSASARAIALAGGQSEPIGGPAARRGAIASAAAALDQEPAGVPDDWTVWGLRPLTVEFWQGDASRDHLRVQYRRRPEGWRTVRLAP